MEHYQIDKVPPATSPTPHPIQRKVSEAPEWEYEEVTHRVHHKVPKKSLMIYDTKLLHGI